MNLPKEIDFLVYHLPDEDGEVKAVVRDETLWTTQKGMAELFGVDKSTISRHLKNIFSEGELDEKVVVAKIATTTPHGAIVGKTQTTDTQFYNLDAIFLYTKKYIRKWRIRQKFSYRENLGNCRGFLGSSNRGKIDR